jgi:TonB family protein
MKLSSLFTLFWVLAMQLCYAQSPTKVDPETSPVPAEGVIIQAPEPGIEDGDGTQPQFKAGEPDPNAYIVVDQEPMAINLDQVKMAIGYPSEAKEKEISGKVFVKILLNEEGRYVRHIVLKDPHAILTKAVEAGLPQLQFTPAIKAGKAIPYWMTIPFEFRMFK